MWHAGPLKYYLQHVYLHIYLWILAEEDVPHIFMFYLGSGLKLLFKIICWFFPVSNTNSWYKTLVIALVSEQNYGYTHCAFYNSMSVLTHKDKKTILYFPSHFNEQATKLLSELKIYHYSFFSSQGKSPKLRLMENNLIANTDNCQWFLPDSELASLKVWGHFIAMKLALWNKLP